MVLPALGWLLSFANCNEPRRLAVVLVAGFSIGEDGTAYVDVHVTGRDLNGNVLFDEKTGHVFQIEDAPIRHFDIRK